MDFPDEIAAITPVPANAAGFTWLAGQASGQSANQWTVKMPVPGFLTEICHRIHKEALSGGH
jgi:hypothetical protein